MTLIDEDAVAEAYWELRSEFCCHQPSRTPKTRDRRDAAKFLAWCRKHDVAPLIFMRERFVRLARAGKYPQLGSMASDLVRRAWEEYREGQVRQQLEEERLEKETGSPFDQLVRALSLPPLPGQEKFKSFYQGGREVLCRAQRDLSGGYHPRSQHCTPCPEAGRCSEEQNRDVGF